MKADSLTRIIITHYIDPSIFEQSDYVIVMGEGRIIEMGTYEQLIDERSAFYQKFILSLDKNEKISE